MAGQFDDRTNDDGEHFCSVCMRPESTAGKMIRLPMNMYLCSDCMDNLSKMMESQFGKNPFASGQRPGAEQMEEFGKMFRSEMNANDREKEVNVPPVKTEIVDSDEEETEEKEDTTETDDTKEEKKTSKGGPRFSIFNMGEFPFPFGAQQPKVKKTGEHKPLLKLGDIPAPHEIKAKLDEYVVGQEQAKRVMSVAVYNHYKRVATNTMDEIEIEKSNMLMIGPTGCGKTYLVRTLARLLDVPLAITDATTLTEAGYIGDDIESVVSKLLAAADNDVDKAEQGIIFIDEIDKIAKKANMNSRDVSGEAVQQGMLKLLEGAEIEVPVGASSKNAMVPTVTVNTRNILFICGGAFPGLEEIIEERLNKTTNMGFTTEVKSKFNKDRKMLQKVEVEDIRKFGMIPEFVGRLPMVFALEALDEDMMVRVLKEPKNAILKQYQKLLDLDGVKLEFEEDALREIAKKAIEKDTGARALRAIIDAFMIDIMYEIPKDKEIGIVTITGDYIRGKGGPRVELRRD